MHVVDWIMLGMVISVILLIAVVMLALLWECGQVRKENNRLKASLLRKAERPTSIEFHAVEPGKPLMFSEEDPHADCYY